jgi:hypothetical protein
MNSGDRVGQQSMSRKWPKNSNPDEPTALVACLHWAYARWNVMHPGQHEERPHIFQIHDFIDSLKGDESWTSKYLIENNISF